MLKKGFVIELSNEKFRTIGSPGGAILQPLVNECLAHMCGWLVAACKTMRAEFPSFEGLLSFQAFSLRPKLSMNLVETHLAKLLQVFGDTTTLRDLIDEYNDCAHFAMKRRRLHALS